MKKMVFLLAVLCAGMVHAAVDYPYLLFTNTAGSVVSMSVSGLTMSVSDNTLVVTNNETNRSFVLTDLASMEFSESATGIEDVLADGKPLKVYGITGLEFGVFNTLLEAVTSLPAGSYVISNGSVTQKIVVK